MENYLSIQTRSGLMDIFVVSPSASGEAPVMIVLQEAFGVNDHIKNVCRRFAQAGYLAVAPELFHREGRHILVEYGDRETMRAHMARLTNEMVLEDVEDVLSFLEELPSADLSRIFVVGFCLGGFASLLSATRFPLSGCVSFYGAGVVRAREGFRLSPFINEFPLIQSPVLLFFGESDASIPASDRDALRVALQNLGKEFELQTFENSDHGFFCEERKTFNQEAAARAWKRMLYWLDRHRGPSRIYSENNIT